nr:reverse transcriptase domain-containing protein [Tanacetum cinerariifolium]
MAVEGNGDPPVPDLQTMEELCQPSLNGQGGPIASIAIQAMNSGLKNDMIQQSIKVNGVTDDALRLYLFPHSLTHHATAWFDRFPRNSINTFEQMAKMFLRKYFAPSMVTKLGNKITNFRQRPDESLFEAWEPQRSESSSSITSSFDQEIVALKAEMAEINKNLKKVLQINQQVKAVTPKCETCGGPHAYNDCSATIGQTQNVYAAGAYQGEYETEVTKETVPPTNNGSTKDVRPLVVQIEPPMPNSEPVIAPVVEPVAAPVSALKPNQIPYPSRLLDQKLRDKTNDQKEKFFKIFQDLNFNISFADTLILMPKDSDFLLKEVDAFLALEDNATLPKVDHSYYDPKGDILLLEAFLNDDPSLPPPSQGRYLPQVRKELKIYEAKNDKSSIDEPLEKLPEKLRDPDKFLIPCDFPGMAECLALADLDASINLMPLFMWNKLLLPDLSPTCMTLKLADRLISRP